MRRFYFTAQGAGEGDLVVLSKEESHHIRRVLRLAPGEVVELLDGNGGVYVATLVLVGNSVEARLDRKVAQAVSGCQLLVGQGVLKGKKMDTVIQKCTELGVNRFRPFVSERCQGVAEERHERRQERYDRISLAACKQCMRPDLMRVDTPCDFVNLLADDEWGAHGLKLLFWEEETQRTLHDIVVPADLSSAVLLLGPEGGFSMEEVERALGCGYQTVSLGTRILRAETATLSAVTVIQFLLGNM